ncbi:MAG: hypothetical protein B7Y39_12495 [Bdellovibrio sp. 28-41-41]|nr:MAG: hypothetical protein B7Y39_12495 [Bdellovibrio sp. 28-41-41]
MKNSFLAAIFAGFAIAFCALAEEAPNGFRAGPNMAAQEANLKDGFKLSDKAKEVIGVKTKSLGSKPFSIPNTALVYYGDKVGVYRLRNGWFKLIEIQKNNKVSGTSSISSSDLSESDQVAIEGVALLRVSEMDVFGGEE